MNEQQQITKIILRAYKKGIYIGIIVPWLFKKYVDNAIKKAIDKNKNDKTES